jgi:hypothetical protein
MATALQTILTMSPSPASFSLVNIPSLHMSVLFLTDGLDKELGGEEYGNRLEREL